MKKAITIILSIILLSAVIGVYFYQKMPEQMASHWNFTGQADDYMPKFWALFLMPAISLVMFLLFMLLPKIDPLKKNIDKFRDYFDRFIILMMLFLLYLHILVIAWNLNYSFSMITSMIPAFGILIYYYGILLDKAKRNYFIGIITPWTLSNDFVWKKTHKLASKLFKIAGIIMLLGMLAPKYSFCIMMASILISALYPVIYSYIMFRRLKKK